MWWTKSKQSNEKGHPLSQDLFPSLQKILEEGNLDPSTVKLALPVPEGSDRPSIENRYEIHLMDKNSRFAKWRISSVRELFRGNQDPSAEMNRYPQEYKRAFFAIESNVLLAHDFLSEVTDEEFIHLYSLVKRRPDARSEGILHDVVYQSAALLLGLTPLSQKEFEAVFGQLALSARHWRMGYSSRNYIHYLKDSYNRLLEKSDPGMQRLLRRVREDKEIVTFDRPSHIRKMSERILEFAEPFLDRIKSLAQEETEDRYDKARKNIIQLCILAWNASLLVDEGERQKAKQEMIQEIIPRHTNEKFSQMMEEWFDEMIQRKTGYFSDEKRIVKDYEFSGSNETLRLNILSVVTPEDAKRLGLDLTQKESLLLG